MPMIVAVSGRWKLPASVLCQKNEKRKKKRFERTDALFVRGQVDDWWEILWVQHNGERSFEFNFKLFLLPRC